MSRNKFTGQVVFITGASSGIGAALARELVARGAHLVLAARSIDRLQALAKELSHGDQRVLFAPCDVTKEGDLEQIVAKARQELGRIDVVIANAGSLVRGRLEDLNMENYRAQFETNVFGVLRTVYATFEDLKKTKGRLVIIGSVNGHVATPGSSAYVMTKFAVRGLADSLRYELAPYGISVTLISPGFVESELLHTDHRGIPLPEFPDSIPQWLQLPAPKAARKIVDAVARRRREKFTRTMGKLAVFLQHCFPGFVSLLVSKTILKSQ